MAQGYQLEVVWDILCTRLMEMCQTLEQSGIVVTVVVVVVSVVVLLTI